ncbi:unnamed protein product [Amoebophrya sp. A120]|nr:unnamed protein product [Amoebophrya sp. A120]|eukprot:GSA120T00008311001.1
MVHLYVQKLVNMLMLPVVQLFLLATLLPAQKSHFVVAAASTQGSTSAARTLYTEGSGLVQHLLAKQVTWFEHGLLGKPPHHHHEHERADEHSSSSSYVVSNLERSNQHGDQSDPVQPAEPQHTSRSSSRNLSFLGKLAAYTAAIGNEVFLGAKLLTKAVIQEYEFYRLHYGKYPSGYHPRKQQTERRTEALAEKKIKSAEDSTSWRTRPATSSFATKSPKLRTERQKYNEVKANSQHQQSYVEQQTEKQKSATAAATATSESEAAESESGVEAAAQSTSGSLPAPVVDQLLGSILMLLICALPSTCFYVSHARLSFREQQIVEDEVRGKIKKQEHDMGKRMKQQQKAAALAAGQAGGTEGGAGGIGVIQEEPAGVVQV